MKSRLDLVAHNWATAMYEALTEAGAYTLTHGDEELRYVCIDGTVDLHEVAREMALKLNPSLSKYDTTTADVSEEDKS